MFLFGFWFSTLVLCTGIHANQHLIIIRNIFEHGISFFYDVGSTACSHSIVPATNDSDAVPAVRCTLHQKNESISSTLSPICKKVRLTSGS